MSTTPTPICMLGEQAMLHRLLDCLPNTTQSGLILGPGDDCAVTRRDMQWDTLLKTDVVVEGVHFSVDTEPRLIGRKALARALSDIAAMGGIPEHALITLLIHPHRTMEFVEELYEGLSDLAVSYGVSIAGGETSSLPQPGLIINVTLIGRVERGHAILRNGGQIGDILCVSGPLGGSFASGRHLSFSPRIELGKALQAAQPRPHAMMDLSDGLAADLPRLAEASRCGYEIDETKLPLNTGCTVSEALNDGEDYELLCALAPETAPQVCTQFGLFPIGRLTERTQGKLSGGWQHFTSSPHA